MNKFVQLGALAVLLALSATAGYLFYVRTQPGNTGSSHTLSATADAPTVTQAGQLNAYVLNNPDGKPYPLGSWHGQPQIINYWATWCAPCREEIPLLVDLQDEYAADKLIVIGLSMDFPEDKHLVKRFMSEQNIDYPVLMAADVGHEIANIYGTNNFVLPISIFVRANGEVGHIHTGVLKREQAQELIRDIL